MTKRFRLRFTFWLDMLKQGEAAIADAIDSLKDERLFSQTVRDGIRLIMSLRSGKLDVLFELFPWVRAEFLQYMRDLQIPDENHKMQTENAVSANDTVTERQRIEQEKMRLEAEQERIEAERLSIELERQRIEAERQQNQSTIQKQLARLEELLIQQGNIPIKSTSKPPNSSGVGLKGLNSGGVGLKSNNLGSNFAAPPPIFDDDDDDLPELTIQKSKASGSTANQNLINGLLGLQKN